MENKKAIIAAAWVGSLILTAGATYFGGNYVQEQQRIQQMLERTGMSAQQIQQMQQNGGGGFFGRQGGSGETGAQNGGPGGRAGFGGMMGARVITGKVDKVSDGSITITTRQGGSQKITLANNATISTTSKANESALKPGQEVWLNGTRGNDGTMQASTVVQIQK